MPAKLFCRTGPLSGASFAFEEEATIGKSPGNTIQLTAEVISGKHARISFDRQRKTFFVEDLKSRNGTWVDGVRVVQKERLGKLNVISFAGSFDFIFQVVDSVAKEPSQRKGTVVEQSQATGGTVFDSEPVTFPGISIPPAKSNPAADARVDQIQSPPLKQENQDAPATGIPTQFDDQSGTPGILPQQIGSKREGPSRKVYSLEILLPGGKPQVFVLKDGENVVGRDRSCDIAVSDSSISRRHAVIVAGPETVKVRDLASKNHTFVDDNIIATEVSLVTGSRISFGSVKARLQEKS